jgi:hypothetical protein
VLEALKNVQSDPKAQSAIQQVLAFWAEHCEQMRTSLTQAEVPRNALAEAGRRVWRRLARGQEGFRTPQGRL